MGVHECESGSELVFAVDVRIVERGESERNRHGLSHYVSSNPSVCNDSGSIIGCVGDGTDHGEDGESRWKREHEIGNGDAIFGWAEYCGCNRNWDGPNEGGDFGEA